MQKALEKLLTGFEKRLAGGASYDALAALLGELNRAVGYAGRSDPKVPLVEGAVVDASLWQLFEPRFNDLATRITARMHELGRLAAQAEREAHTATLRLFFRARFEDLATEEELQDATLLAECHGIRDKNAPGNVDFSGTPVLPGLASAVLEFDRDALELNVVVELPLSTQVAPEQATLIQRRVEAVMDRGWGLNPGFELPAALYDHTFHFAMRSSRYEVV